MSEMREIIRVLMVTDSTDDAGRILSQMNHAGYSIEHTRVETAGEMEAALTSQVWDLITADYYLSQFNVSSALAVLQKSALDIPLIVISGEVTDEIAVGLMQAGAQDYLNKDRLARLVPVLERELVQAERRRKHHQAEIAQQMSEEKSRLLVDRLPVGIVVLNQDGLIVEWNRTQSLIFGLEKAEALGKPGWEVQYEFFSPANKTPENLLLLKTEILNYLQHGRLSAVSQKNEYPIFRRDNTQRWVEVSTFTYVTAEGNFAVTNSIDISARRQAVDGLSQHGRDINLLYDASLELVRALDLDSLLETFYRQISTSMPCDTFFISSFNEQQQMIRCMFGNVEGGALDVSTLPAIPLEPEGHGIQSQVIRSGKPWLVRDYVTVVKTAATQVYVTAEGKIEQVEDVPDDEEFTRSGIILPMVFKNKILGAIQILSNKIDAFSDRDYNLAEALAAQFSIAFNNSILYREAQNEIAERVRTEVALKESNQRFLKAFEYAVSGMTMRGLDGRWLKVNRALCDMVGYSEQELLVMKYQDIVHPDDLQDALSPNSALLTEDIDSYEPLLKRFIHKDGHLVWVMMNITVMRNESNQPQYYMSQVTDITELKRVEDQLHLQSAALVNAASAIVITNRDGIIEWVNPAWSVLTGYPTVEVLGRTMNILNSGVQAKDYFQNLWTTILRGEVFRGELTNKRKDGSLYIEDQTVAPVRNEKGDITHFVAIKQDITERKAADEALRRSEESNRQILQMALDGYLMLDLQGNVLDVNDAYSRLIGYSRQELLEMNIADIDVYETDGKTAEYISHMIDVGAQRFETRQRRKDGSIRDIEISSQYSPNDGGRLVAFLEDITDRKQAEADLWKAHIELEQRVAERTVELQNANLALEKAARLKDEFLASMSHELRTPLTGILGLSEALQMVTYGDVNEKQRRALRNIESSGRHLLSLINDMLDLSKIEAGKYDLQMEICSLTEICQSSLQLTRGMANQKHQNATFTIEPTAIFLNADARRVKQMLVNLLGNAIKFTPDGGRLGIEVVGDAIKQEVKITVWDEGIGIREEDIPRLFQPFVQLDSGLTRQYSGTGLGLSLVRRLVELHSGRVLVESIFGKGSRFSVILPWKNTQPMVRESRPGTGPLVWNASPADIGPMVLMADDNDLILTLISDYLVTQKFRVSMAHSGAEFLMRLEQVMPDVVLMDIQMPGMNGLDVIRRIRENPIQKIANVPVIAVTALAMAGDKELCLAAGANAYMSKPVLLKSLVEMIHELIPMVR